jgi:glycerophosphoryl diester phosphodiesterase
MDAKKGPSRGLQWLRRIWTALTFLLALPILLPVALGGLLYASIISLRAPQGWWYGVRLHTMQVTLFVFGRIMGASTWLFNSLLGKSLYTSRPSPRLRRELLIVGHRGAPIQECENTLRSFATAIRQGANAIELDLCYTLDQEVVIWHDWDPNDTVALFREAGSEPLQRCKPRFGEGPFRRPAPLLTFADLRTHCGYLERKRGTALPSGQGQIPTWRAFLEAAKAWPSLRTVFLDMKVPPCDLQYAQPMIKQIQADIEAVNPAFECVVMTIYPEVLAAFKSVAPTLRYCYDKEFPPLFQDTAPGAIAERSTVREAITRGNDFASVGRPTFLALAPWEVYKNVITHDLGLRRATENPPQLIAWTINEPDELRWLINSGVDGILTDQPRYLAELELRRKTIMRFWQAPPTS